MNAFLQELFHLGVYKRSQGRITRQVTLAGIALLVAVGFYRVSQLLETRVNSTVLSLGIPLLLTMACWWIAYRTVNIPKFADFLIAVEAEMNKVSWPTRGELFRSSLVVLICIIVLAAVLAVFDGFWFWLFKQLGVI